MLFFLLTIFLSGLISDFISTLAALVLAVPYISISVRRLHDVNKSGLFLAIPVFNLYLLFKKGDMGTNQFGKSPL
jgi:uncharacterized membrane protein YhaH (DUF805 family)